MSDHTLVLARVEGRLEFILLRVEKYHRLEIDLEEINIENL
jgi:hypothetical protein